MNFSKMSKAQLREYASKKGIKTLAAWTKSELIDAVSRKRYIIEFLSKGKWVFWQRYKSTEKIDDRMKFVQAVYRYSKWRVRTVVDRPMSFEGFKRACERKGYVAVNRNPYFNWWQVNYKAQDDNKFKFDERMGLYDFDNNRYSYNIGSGWSCWHIGTLQDLLAVLPYTGNLPEGLYYSPVNPVKGNS